MTKEKVRETMEKLVFNWYDSLIKVMDDSKQEFITRKQLMDLKLEFQSRMDLT